MKYLIFISLITLLTFNAQAQNVGIGTSAPQQKLHVEGTTLLNGNVGIGTLTPGIPLSFSPVFGDKISLWSNSSNSYGFGIQGSLLQIHTDISAADIAFGFGSSISFNETMRIKGNGNVGIGTSTPGFPLNFADVTGDKISLYGNSGDHYGFGIQGFLMQIHSNDASADIAFGYGSSASFNETMRVKGNGNVGIGTTTPGAKLHVVSGASGYIGGYFPGITLEGSGNTYFNLLAPNSNETAVLFGKASDAGSGGIVYNNTTTLNGLQFRTNGNSTKMVLDQNGKMGIGTNIPAATLEVNGFTKLGSDAPSIKVKKLTGITAATEGGWIQIAHGLNSSRIISVTAIVSYGTGAWYGPNTAGLTGGANFRLAEGFGVIDVQNIFGDSAGILSKPIKILITYEE